MKSKNNYWVRLGNFAALSVLIIVIVVAALATWVRYGESFIGYYAPAKVTLNGDNPYEYDRVVTMILQTTGKGGNSPFYYPLWSVFPIFPLVTIPFEWGRALWIILGLGAAFIALRLFTRMFGENLPPWARWLVWLYAFFVCGWMTLRTEQIAFLMLLDLAVTLWAMRTRHSNIAAVALALLLGKFNITFLPAFALAFYAWRHSRRVAIGAAIALAILFALTLVVTPNWWEPILAGRLPNGWNQGLRGYEVDGRRLTTTTSDFLMTNWNVPEIFGRATQVVIALAAMLLIYRWRDSLIYVTLLSIPLGFMITPYAMQYDYALFAPACLWLVLRMRGAARWQIIIFALSALFMASVLFWEGPVSDALWITITLLALLLLNAPKIEDTKFDAQAIPAL